MILDNISWINTVFNMIEIQFHETFRMDKENFKEVYKKIFPENNTEKNETEFLIFLLYLSHAPTYRKLREETGRTHSTCWIIIKKKGDELYKLSVKFIRLPEDVELIQISNSFSQKGSLEQWSPTFFSYGPATV
ncbi:hypothetical protein DMUE_3429 [Dictyocoela muelleri]|nr:hypothetical protein DMUE_3429 [Dictyocoela muelleri]